MTGKRAIFIFLLLTFWAGLPAVRPQTAPEATETPETSKSPEKTPKYEIQLQTSTETLSRGLGTWRTAAVYAERRFANRQIVWGTYRRSTRAGNRDQEFIGGIYKPLANKWAVTAEAMYSPTARYVGKFSVMGEVEKALKKGYVAHFGARFTRYTTVRATSAYGLLEKYWGNNRAAYTLYLTRLSNAGTAPTHRVQYNRYYGERVNSFGATVAYGKEHENLGPSLGILRSRTWSVGLSMRHWMTKRFGLTVDGTLHRQGDLYYRRGLSFGIRYRF